MQGIFYCGLNVAVLANFVPILQNYTSGIAEEKGRHYIVLVRYGKCCLGSNGRVIRFEDCLCAGCRAFNGFWIIVRML